MRYNYDKQIEINSTKKLDKNEIEKMIDTILYDYKMGSKNNYIIQFHQISSDLLIAPEFDKKYYKINIRFRDKRTKIEGKENEI